MVGFDSFDGILARRWITSKQDFWKQPLATFQNDFWVMLPLFGIVAVVVWWLRGQKSEREIGGLKAEISVLKERLKAQISVMEERLKLATEALATSDGAKSEVQKQLQTLEVAIAGKADVASLSALTAKLDTAVGQWAIASTAVSNAVSRNTNTPWFDPGSGLEGARSGFAAETVRKAR